MQVSDTGLYFAASYFSPFLKIVPMLSSSSRHHLGIFILIIIFSIFLPQYLTTRILAMVLAILILFLLPFLFFFSRGFCILPVLLFFYFSSTFLRTRLNLVFQTIFAAMHMLRNVPVDRRVSRFPIHNFSLFPPFITHFHPGSLPASLSLASLSPKIANFGSRNKHAPRTVPLFGPGNRCIFLPLVWSK